MANSGSPTHRGNREHAPFRFCIEGLVDILTAPMMTSTEQTKGSRNENEDPIPMQFGVTESAPSSWKSKLAWVEETKR